MTYTLAPFVTAEMLEKEGFTKTDDLYAPWCSSVAYFIDFNKIIKDNKTRTTWIGIVLRTTKYDIKTKTTTSYKSHRIVTYTKNKRKNYGGYINDIIIVVDDMAPFIQDLIDKKMVIVNG